MAMGAATAAEAVGNHMHSYTMCCVVLQCAAMCCSVLLWGGFDYHAP